MNEQELMEEIDRLARLCKAKDAEIKKQQGVISLKDTLIENIESQLSEAQAQIAIQADVLSDIIPFIGYQQHVPHLVKRAEDVKSATSETVAAWRAKETEPLRREVAMLHEMMNRASVSLGAFCSDEGWVQSDMDTLDSVGAAIAATQATALAYELEVKAKAHDIAFECAARIIEGRLRDDPRDVNHEIRKCAAAVRDKGWQIKFLADYAELRAAIPQP